jgi:hypothetical protein
LIRFGEALFPDDKSEADFGQSACFWRKNAGVQHYSPFQDAVCAVPYRYQRHTYWPNIEVFIDPQPAPGD